MNRIALAAAALVSVALVACAGSAQEPTQTEGRQDYSDRVPADQGQKALDDVKANGVTINGQVCYPRITRCSVSAPDADGLVTVLASLCCPDEACYVDTTAP